jgi:hypothetical protein
MALFGRSNFIQGAGRWLFCGVAVFLLSSGVGLALQRWPTQGRDPAGVGFDESRASADLRAFVGDGTPRVVGSAGAAQGRDRVVELLSGLGLAVERRSARIERRAGAVDLENLVARIPGRVPGPARIAVVAHTDSVPGAPGASDDGAGVACALGVARSLLADPPRHDTLLVLTDGEERGLLGAQAFLAQDPAAAELRAVVNLDARGASGPAFVFETGPETAWLSSILARRVPAVRANSLMGVVYGAMPNGTDFTVFLRQGISGFNVAFVGDVGAYHTPDDTVERQSAATRAHMGMTAISLVRALDEELPKEGIPAGRAVFGDLAGVAMLRWPEEWTLPMAVGGVLALGACCAFGAFGAARPSHRAPGRAAGIALAASVAVVALLACIGWGFGAAARTAGMTMATAPLRLQVLDAALFAAAVVAAIGVGAWLARCRVDPWSAMCGAWSPWAAVAVAAAWAVPAASFAFVVPIVAVAVAAVGASIAWRTGPADRLRPAAFMGAAAAGLVLLPLEPAFLDALGFQLGWLNGLRAGLLAVTLVPLATDAASAGSDTR